MHYWQQMTKPLMYLGMNNPGEVPLVPGQMEWWVNGNPFSTWAESTSTADGGSRLSPNGPLTSESHSCFGLLATWMAACAKGPFYRTAPAYDPYGSSGPEASDSGVVDNSCGVLMNQYTRLCQGKPSIHDLSPYE